MKKHHSLYPTSTGQTIVSPVNLDYAMNPYHQIEIDRITPADFTQINILADEAMAYTIRDLMDKKTWRTADEIIAAPSESNVQENGEYCVMQGSTVYIRHGRKFEPLSNVIEKSDKLTLSIVLRFVACQAALCQAAIAKLLNERGSATE